MKPLAEHDALAASIAHEVNQPLAAIMINASTCLRMLAVDPPNLEGARATAQRTIRDAKRTAEVIQRLRAMFARKQPSTDRVDLNDAVGEVLALSAGELEGARVALSTNLADSLPSIRGDRIQLQQVILNLVLNAADAMRDVQGRPRKLEIRTCFHPPSDVTLLVRDEGTGIRRKDQKRLFDPFYTTKKEGMGIGLTISRAIVKAHYGRIWAAPNENGIGSTFSFSIPGDRDLST